MSEDGWIFFPRHYYTTININEADLDELATLPGIGPVTAQRILNYRDKYVGFIKMKALKNVDGVGDTEVGVINQNIIDTEMYDAIRKGVNLAVEPRGTAFPLFNFPAKFGFEVAGKTGTSEFISPQGEEKTHAIFVAFSPYYDDEVRQANMSSLTDRPVVVTVFLEGGEAVLLMRLLWLTNCWSTGFLIS